MSLHDSLPYYVSTLYPDVRLARAMFHIHVTCVCCVVPTHCPTTLHVLYVCAMYTHTLPFHFTCVCYVVPTYITPPLYICCMCVLCCSYTHWSLLYGRSGHVFPMHLYDCGVIWAGLLQFMKRNHWSLLYGRSGHVFPMTL